MELSIILFLALISILVVGYGETITNHLKDILSILRREPYE